MQKNYVLFLSFHNPGKKEYAISSRLFCHEIYIQEWAGYLLTTTATLSAGNDSIENDETTKPFLLQVP
jgi:hypothetical protein